jgi:hypothetical protein
MTEQITVNIGGVSKDLFMSFGLLNEVTAIVGDIEGMAMLQIDPVMRERILNAVLADRSDIGAIAKPVNFFDPKQAPAAEEAHKILDWVAENAIGFFLTSLGAAKSLAERHEKQVKDLMSSLAGSPT